MVQTQSKRTVPCKGFVRIKTCAEDGAGSILKRGARCQLKTYDSMAFLIIAMVASKEVIICFFIMSSMPGILGIPSGVNWASICMTNFVPSPSGSNR